MLSSLFDQNGEKIGEGFLVRGIFYKVGEDEGDFVIPRETDTVRPLSPASKPQA